MVAATVSAVRTISSGAGHDTAQNDGALLLDSITSITAADVVGLVRAKKQTAPAQARNLLAHIKRLMGWAADMQVYGFTVSPIGASTERWPASPSTTAARG